eukprot:UN31723
MCEPDTRYGTTVCKELKRKAKYIHDVLGGLVLLIKGEKDGKDEIVHFGGTLNSRIEFREALGEIAIFLGNEETDNPQTASTSKDHPQNCVNKLKELQHFRFDLEEKLTKIDSLNIDYKKVLTYVQVKMGKEKAQRNKFKYILGP